MSEGSASRQRKRCGQSTREPRRLRKKPKESRRGRDDNGNKKKSARLGPLERQLQNTMTDTLAMDVAEIYSPERVTQHAKQAGLEPGWSLDLTTTDVDGRPWDFTKVEMRNRA